MNTASIRDLRNQFPRIRKLLESGGEVLLTERGKPLYRLSVYQPLAVGEPAAVDYWRRLSADQPMAISAEDAAALRDHNRGER
jgi:antitoxin (DNA-binding transcriptional repressor) of toxin-antitoxin stability system